MKYHICIWRNIVEGYSEATLYWNTKAYFNKNILH